MSYIPATMTTQYPGQQQVVVIQQQAPVRQGPRVYDKYASGQSKFLGIFQIVMGFLAIIFNAAAIGIEVKIEHLVDATMSYSGMGIWSGLWFILTGAFGVQAAKSKKLCPIVAFMVLSIISVCLWNFVFLGLAAAGLGIANEGECYSNYYYTSCEKNGGLVAMMAILLIISLTEFVVAIWSSIICCSAVCCCDRSTTTYPVQYVTNPQGGQVMILQNGGTGYAFQQGGTSVVTNTQFTAATGYPQGQAYQPYPYQTVQPNTNLSTQPQVHQPQPQHPQFSAPPQASSSYPAEVPAPPIYESGPPPAYAQHPGEKDIEQN